MDLPGSLAWRWLGAAVVAGCALALVPSRGARAQQAGGGTGASGDTETADPGEADASADGDADTRPAASLTYERERGAEQCPDERELRDAVSARLGYVPFHDDAPQHVRTVIRAARGGLLATVDVFDAEGAQVGQRSIRSRTRDCEELARGVALAISVAIDPVSLLGPPAEDGSNPAGEPRPAPEPDPAPEPEPTPEPTPAPESVPVPVPLAELAPMPVGISDAGAPAPESTGARVRIAIDVQLAVEAVPRIRPGFALRLDVEGQRLGAELLLRGVLPASASSGLGRVRAYQVDVHALGCVLGWGLRGCAGAFAGLMPARGEQVASPRQAVGPVAGIALALGYDRALVGRLALGLRVGLDVPLVRPRLELAMTEVWRGAPVSALASIGLGVRLR